MSPQKKTHSSAKPEHKDKHVPSDAELEVELGKTKWGSTSLTQALKDAERNVQITYILSAGYFDMLEGLAELMHKANAQLRISASDVSSFVLVSLFGRTIGSFLAAVRLATSGQITESYAQLRACIENALYAFYISSDPALAKIWLDRHKSSQARKVCKDSFKVSEFWKVLKSENAALEKRVHKAYDTCIDFGAHPNERSVMMNVEVSRDNGVTLHLFNTQDVIFDLSLLAVVHVMLCVVEGGKMGVTSSIYKLFS